MSNDTISSCFPDGTDAEKEILQLERSLKLKYILKVYFGYLSIPFAGLGLIMSFIFIIAVIKAVKQHRVSRKCYVLIINRSIGDALSCIMALILMGYVLVKEEPNQDIVHVYDILFIASFWSGMISYVSLSVLKLFAVARPFHYRGTVTMKSCIYLVIGSWVIFLIVLGCTLGATAITKISFLRHWSGCKIETCLRRAYRTRNALTVGIYFFTIICFILTVIYLYRARKFVHTFHKNRHSTTVKPKFLQFPLWKLAINVATFAFFNSFYIIRIVAILIYGNSDKCFWQNNKPLMMETLGIVRLFLLARIIVDPIISFIMDYQIKKSILNMFGIHGRVEPSDSSRPFRKETSSSDCQSRIKTSTTIFENELSAQSKNNTDMNL